MALFRRSRPEAQLAPSPLSRGSVELPSGRDRRVAGLSYHTKNLKRITRGAPNQASGWKVTATLVREPQNQYESERHRHLGRRHGNRVRQPR
jgi:hypothetical protein